MRGGGGGQNKPKGGIFWETISDTGIRKKATRPALCRRDWVHGFTRFWRLPPGAPYWLDLKPSSARFLSGVRAVEGRGKNQNSRLQDTGWQTVELAPKAPLPHLVEDQGFGGKSISRNESSNWHQPLSRSWRRGLKSGIDGEENCKGKRGDEKSDEKRKRRQADTFQLQAPISSFKWAASPLWTESSIYEGIFCILIIAAYGALPLQES